MEELETKIKNLTFIVILGFVILLMLVIGLYFKGGSNTDTKTNNESSSTNNSTEYDVSKMNEVDVDGALELFKDKDVHVLYLGRSTCSACIKFVPVLNEVQEDLGFTVDYLDVATFMNNWSSAKEDLEPLTNKMTVEATANGETGTLGELFLENGFTPALVIIKDGKVVDGFFGYRDTDTLSSLLKEYFE